MGREERQVSSRLPEGKRNARYSHELKGVGLYAPIHATKQRILNGDCDRVYSRYSVYEGERNAERWRAGGREVGLSPVERAGEAQTHGSRR